MNHNIEALSEIFDSNGQVTVSHKRDLFSSDTFDSAKLHETYRLEPSDGLSLPIVIMPAMDDAEDFFATVATYYQNQSPISALVHILSKETVNLFSDKPKASNTRRSIPDRTFRIACIGTAIGEATLTGLAAQNLDGVPSYATCKRTLSFSLCRTTQLYGKKLRTGVVAERWKKLRKLTGLSVSEPTTEAVLLAHGFASKSATKSSLSRIETTLGKTLQKLIRSDEHDSNLLESVLTELYPGTKQFFDDLTGVFDGRMSAFRGAVESIQANSRGVHTDEIAVAFACNRILPGSFAHAGVLVNLVEFFPSALVWYGFLSALSATSKSQQLNQGLITKLERDLVDVFNFEQRPRCDISLEELEVLSRTQLRTEIVKPSQQRALLVALLPGVNIYTRFGSGDNEVVDKKHQREVEAEVLHGRVSKLLEEALYTLKKVEKVSTKRRQNKIR